MHCAGKYACMHAKAISQYLLSMILRVDKFCARVKLVIVKYLLRNMGKNKLTMTGYWIYVHHVFDRNGVENIPTAIAIADIEWPVSFF